VSSLSGRKPKEPALQNIPVRTPLGRRIRDAVFGKIGIHLNVDYSELEKRIMEHVEEQDEDPNRPGK
jgi:DNA polymerase-1